MGFLRDVKYKPIDGMRCYAAILVFFVHFEETARTLLTVVASSQGEAPDPTYLRILAFLKEGHHGVDIFFLISGFLMGRIIYAKGELFSYSGYIASRVARIYPAFLVSYVVGVVYLSQSFGLPVDAYNVIAGLFFLNAIDQLKIIPYNYVSWSLGYEFAFYLIIPFTLILRRLPRPYVAALLLALVFVFLPADFIRMDGLFIGFLISSWTDRQLKRAAGFIPLWPTLVAYSTIILLKRAGFVSFLECYHAFIVASALLFVKIVFEENFMSKFFQLSALRAFGVISYSFYLFHVASLSFVEKNIMPLLLDYLNTPALVVGVGFLTSFAFASGCAVLSYWLIERRYFQRRSHLSEPRPSPVAAPNFASSKTLDEVL